MNKQSKPQPLEIFIPGHAIGMVIDDAVNAAAQNNDTTAEGIVGGLKGYIRIKIRAGVVKSAAVQAGSPNEVDALVDKVMAMWDYTEDESP